MVKVGDVYKIDEANKLGLLVEGARVRTDGSTDQASTQFTGIINKVVGALFYVQWDDRHGGAYDSWLIYKCNKKARIEFLDDDENTPTNKKEGSKSMTGNTTNVAVNDTIMEVLAEEKSRVANEVNKYFCEEIPDNLTGKILLEGNLPRFKKAASDRAKEDKKKADAKKG